MTLILDAGIPAQLALRPSSAQLPRFISPIHPQRAGSWGESCVNFASGLPIHAGRVTELRYWQKLVLDRALECDSNGNLLWRTVVVSAPRQSGKSVLERVLCLWRIHQRELFAEAQTVLHVANTERTAQEIWRPAMHWVMTTYGRNAVRTGHGQTSFRLPDGSRWLVQAATISAGVGFTLSMVLVDEAWNVHRNVVEAALSPTMVESRSPQLWLVSTAGTSDSDLMRAYRNYALNGSTDTLLIEWSAPDGPDVDASDPAVWRDASPHWDDNREAFIASRLDTTEQWAFRQQYLNQWVPTLVTPLIDSSLIDDVITHEPLPDGAVTFGVDIAADRSHASIVAYAGDRFEVIEHSDGVLWVVPRLIELIDKWNPPKVAIDAGGPGQTVADQLKGTEYAPVVEGYNGRELASACMQFYDLLTTRNLSVRAHPAMVDALINARKRSYGQSWLFARDSNGVSCVPLLAAVLALGAAGRRDNEVEASAIW